MKAISIRAPWWLAILEWGKRVENRFWSAPIAYRGPVLLHASAWWDDVEVQLSVADAKRTRETIRARGIDLAKAQIRSYEWVHERRGGIVGRARLIDCRWNRNSGDPWAIDAGPNLPPRFRETGALGLWLDDVEPLPFVPLKGALGLFDVTRESVLADQRRAKDGPEHRVAMESLLSVLDDGAPMTHRCFFCGSTGACQGTKARVAIEVNGRTVYSPRCEALQRARAAAEPIPLDYEVTFPAAQPIDGWRVVEPWWLVGPSGHAMLELDPMVGAGWWLIRRDIGKAGPFDTAEEAVSA